MLRSCGAKRILRTIIEGGGTEKMKSRVQSAQGRGRITLKVGKYKEHFIEIDEDSMHKKHIIVRGVNVPIPLSVVLEETYDTVTEAWRAAKRFVNKHYKCSHTQRHFIVVEGDDDFDYGYEVCADCDKQLKDTYRVIEKKN
jgi:hypothetical protein